MRALFLAIAFSALIAAPVVACDPSGNPLIPPVAAVLDEALPEAKLPEMELAKVKTLRARITTLLAAGNETTARKLEEEAMKILGYTKAWLKCGPGTFIWMKTRQDASS